jgi:hypothetical protein
LPDHRFRDSPAGLAQRTTLSALFAITEKSGKKTVALVSLGKSLTFETDAPAKQRTSAN